MWKIDKDSRTGATGAAYADALSWRTEELGRMTILLKNTHGSNSLKYRLSGYVAEGGIARELVAETTLLSGEVAEFDFSRQWHRLQLQVVNGSGAATYQVDYQGQGA